MALFFEHLENAVVIEIIMEQDVRNDVDIKLLSGSETIVVVTLLI